MDFKYQADGFSLKSTLECGQCFRWKKLADGSFFGVVGNHSLRIEQKEDTVIFYDTTEEEFQQLWRNYFDFDTDYHTIYQQICTDSVIEKSYTYTDEIHILRQQPCEALCSFIISQNNNIPRITGIIDRLCRQFGEPMKNGVFSFPSPQRLASLHVDDLAGLRAGFRAKYILDAARKITDGTIDIQGIYHSNIDEARKELQKICGVGPKVADCVLLFGFYRLEAFPVDVWIKRAMNYFYQNGFPKELMPYGGIAQQVIFHYIRCCADALPEGYSK